MSVVVPRLETPRLVLREFLPSDVEPYARIMAEEFVDGLVTHGVPVEEAHVFAEIFGTVLDGRNAHLTDGVQRALGRPPRDFATYAATTAATDVWR